MFSGGIERNQWHKMGYDNNNDNKKDYFLQIIVVFPWATAYIYLKKAAKLQLIREGEEKSVTTCFGCFENRKNI